MPRINPEILSWARETAGLDFAEAAHKVSLGSARGMEPADRLAAMEQGVEEPSRALLGRMAKQYRRPLVAFYLAHPPLGVIAGVTSGRPVHPAHPKMSRCWMF